MSDVVPVVPSQVAVIVTEPLVLPVAVVLNWPLISVVPVDDPKVTRPVTDCVSSTSAPETGFPPASFTVTVRLVEPVVGIADASEVIETVDPSICTGICAVISPADVVVLAVIVAVRLALFAALSPPRERVTVPGVVTLGALRTPVSVLKYTVTPEMIAFPAFNALTVMVDVVEPSVLIDVGDAARSREDASSC